MFTPLFARAARQNKEIFYSLVSPEYYDYEYEYTMLSYRANLAANILENVRYLL